MEETKKHEAGQELSPDDAAEIAGGTSSCPATVTVGIGSTQVVQQGTSTGDALTQLYDGVVDATSHVIETVAHAVK